MLKCSSNSQTQMPSSPTSAGTPEPEKSQQPRPSAIMESILTLVGSERARPRATSLSTLTSTETSWKLASESSRSYSSFSSAPDTQPAQGRLDTSEEVANLVAFLASD